jgi:hypothetical protein
VWVVVGWRRGGVVSSDSVCGWGGSPTAEDVLRYHVSVVWLIRSCFPVPTCMYYTRMCDWGWWGHYVGCGGVETWGVCLPASSLLLIRFPLLGVLILHTAVRAVWYPNATSDSASIMMLFEVGVPSSHWTLMCRCPCSHVVCSSGHGNVP